MSTAATPKNPSPTTSARQCIAVAFERVGLFDPNLKFGEDADWFTRAKEAALQIERLEQVTLIVRRHAANMTRGKSLVELNALRVLKLAIDRRRALTATA